MSADEASYVREQYATPHSLRARKAAYVNAAGDDPRDFVLEAVGEVLRRHSQPSIGATPSARC